MSDKQCNGICITAADIGVPYGDLNAIAYPHPECELHYPPSDTKENSKSSTEP